MEQELLDEIDRVRSVGFAIISHRETVKKVMYDVERGINHRLEDIFTYASRENPNREEIMDIVRECQEHLIRVRGYHMKYPV